MTEEIKKEEEAKNCCVCELVKCETCRKFLIVTVGTFVGMFCAMSLFFTLHKPPMMMPHAQHFGHGAPMMERPMGHHHHHHHFRGHDNFGNGKFSPRPDFEKQFPNDDKKPEFED